MLNWQGKKTAEAENDPSPTELRVGIAESIYTDGITVRFAGETKAGSKRYPYNRDTAIGQGDRVLLGRVAGSYVVICRF